MHRIDGAGYGPGNQFTEGNPGTGVPPTRVTDDWLNDMQEEIAKVVEAAGVPLVKGTTSQLLTALRKFGIAGGTGPLDLTGAGGGQIIFPATQNPSANPNAFDDSERGNCTPSGNVVTLTGASGFYLKLGRFVFCSMTATFPAGAGIDAARFNGLPFSSNANVSVGSAVTTLGSGVGVRIPASNTYLEFTNLSGVALTNGAMSGVTATASFGYNSL
jgi:hypothetical protein